MNKFQTLLMYKEGTLDAKEAARLLKMTPKGLSVAMAKYGSHLSFILQGIALLQVADTKPQQTKLKHKMADRLRISYNQVNRMLRMGGVDIPSPKIVEIREKARENAKKRREITEKTVKNLAKGTVSLEKAAQNLEISERQVSRHLSELVSGLGYTVPAFKKLPKVERARLIK
jgi:hypothetical protein